MAQDINTFLEHYYATRELQARIESDEKNTLLDQLTEALEAAIHEGRRIATGSDERGFISATKNLAGRAVAIISEVIDQLTEQVQQLLDAGDDIEDIDSQVEEWIADYADLVAATEIQQVVEEAVLDQLTQNGVERVYWLAEADACSVCMANAEASPLAIGADWPSGDAQPPAHPRCRCSLAPE